MTRKFSHREYVLGGLFALLAMFPMVTSTELNVPLEGSAVSREAIDRAFDDRENQSALRRMRWSVLRDCAQREARGETDVCPDMNDTTELNRYWLPAKHEAATVEETIAATMNDLGGNELHILRRAKRVGQCPSNLDTIVSGFQALCEKTIGKGDERLDQLEEATERMQRRPSGTEAVPSQHYRLKSE